MRSSCMWRNFRLTRKADFKLLFGRGKRVDSPFLRLVYRQNSIGHVRLALITPRSIEKRSVLRNRLRRRTREWMRRRDELLDRPIDVAVIFKRASLGVAKKRFYEELEKIFTGIRAV